MNFIAEVRYLRPDHERGDFTEKVLEKNLPEVGFKKMSKRVIKEMMVQDKFTTDMKPNREWALVLSGITDRIRKELKITDTK